MADVESIFQIMSIDLHFNYRPPTTLTRSFQLWMHESLLVWLDGESIHPSNIEH